MLYFEQCKSITLDYDICKSEDLIKLIYNCVQINHLKRPKITEMRELVNTYLVISGANREMVLGSMFDYKNFPGQSRVKEVRRACFLRLSSQRVFKEISDQVEAPGEESLAFSKLLAYKGPKSSMENCLSLKRLRWNSLHKPQMKQLIKSKIDWLQRESELSGLKFNPVM